MNRFTSLLRKELTEFARTWKIWVIPGLLSCWQSPACSQRASPKN